MRACGWREEPEGEEGRGDSVEDASGAGPTGERGEGGGDARRGRKKPGLINNAVPTNQWRGGGGVGYVMCWLKVGTYTNQ